MCRHCEKIKEHPEDKPIAHAFMKRTAQRIREQTGHARLTADNIDVTIDADLFAYGSIGDVEIYDPVTKKCEQARTKILKMLDEMHK